MMPILSFSCACAPVTAAKLIAAAASRTGRFMATSYDFLPTAEIAAGSLGYCRAHSKTLFIPAPTFARVNFSGNPGPTAGPPLWGDERHRVPSVKTPPHHPKQKCNPSRDGDTRAPDLAGAHPGYELRFVRG